MYYIDRLIKEANDAARLHGHDPKRWTHDAQLTLAYTTCKHRHCIAYVAVRTNPLPNEIDIGGDMIAMGCPVTNHPSIASTWRHASPLAPASLDTKEETMIKEYGQVGKDEYSVRTTLDTIGPDDKRFTLIHGTEGYEPAGSCARHTTEYWAIEQYIDGNLHGRKFSDRDRAMAEWGLTYLKSTT